MRGIANPAVVPRPTHTIAEHRQVGAVCVERNLLRLGIANLVAACAAEPVGRHQSSRGEHLRLIVSLQRLWTRHVGNAIVIDEERFDGTHLVARQIESRHANRQPRSQRRPLEQDSLFECLVVQFITDARKRRRRERGQQRRQLRVSGDHGIEPLGDT